MDKNTVENKLSVLFENQNIIAIDKRPGIIVIPDQHTELSRTLVGMAQTLIGGKLWVVHRIDKGTSGIVVFAKNAEAHADISQQFEKGLVSKLYLALVNGSVLDDSGTIDAPISVDGREVGLDKDGKPSVTNYRVAERFRDFTLVEAMPGTGRRHQIRLHFMSLGHTLAVDPQYSGRDALFLSEFKKKYKATGTEKPLLSRLSLHARNLTLTEPVMKTPVNIESPVPHDLEVTLKMLRKYNKPSMSKRRAIL